MPVRVEEIIQRIRREIAEETAAKSTDAATPADAEALPKITYRPELNYLNRNWELFDPLAEPLRSHRRIFGPMVLSFKTWLRRFVLVGFDRYFQRERFFFRELVRFNNELAERSDRVLREVTERTKAVAERNDVFLAAFDMRLEVLEAREQMRAALASTPAEDVAISDGDEAVLAEMAAALGGGIGDRVGPFCDLFRSIGPVLVLGCGGGEVLRSLDGVGPAVAGVESSSRLISECRAQGYEVTLSGLRPYLEAVPEGSLGGVILAGVADRHPRASWPRLVACAWRSLRPGGVVLFEGVGDRASLARLRWLLGRQRFSTVDARVFPEPASGGEAHVLVGRRSEVE